MEQPAIVLRKDRLSQTALRLAVAKNNLIGLSLLLAHPAADITVGDDEEMTLLDLCRWGTDRQGETL